MSTPAAPILIAVDGPSGTGKSSVSKAVARTMGAGYLDTGAMYRALTWWVLDQGIDPLDQERVAAEAATFPLVMGTDPANPGVTVDGRDIGDDIRTARITSAVTAIATNPFVRPVLQRLQRQLMDAIAAERGAVVAEGRDITTVVAPDADVRILMTASEEARLRRRSLEVHGTTDEAAVEATRDLVVQRDRADSTVSEFTVAADGVVTVDTSDLTFEQSVDAVVAIVAVARV
ncbi:MULTISPECIES: (d)CMP kinase [unclassified Janibacter]|uniref:(d)CMP kinase n=1 Tax=unclassified Janibacter TaxID=2649294 RepID=UPI003D0804D9